MSNHMKTVCRYCDRVVTQCRCSSPHKTITYVDSCQRCKGIPQPVTPATFEKVTGVEQYSQYRDGWLDGANLGVERWQTGPSYVEYHRGYRDGKAARNAAVEAAHARLVPPEPVQGHPGSKTTITESEFMHRYSIQMREWDDIARELWEKGRAEGSGSPTAYDVSEEQRQRAKAEGRTLLSLTDFNIIPDGRKL